MAVELKENQLGRALQHQCAAGIGLGLDGKFGGNGGMVVIHIEIQADVRHQIFGGAVVFEVVCGLLGHGGRPYGGMESGYFSAKRGWVLASQKLSSGCVETSFSVSSIDAVR